MAVAPVPGPAHTLFVVSGATAASDALTALSVRSRGGESGGSILAPWLLSGPVLLNATSEVVASPLDLQGPSAQKYPNMLATVFPSETPTYAGYLGWLGGSSNLAEGPVTYYGAAQVNVPMGGAMDDMSMGSGPGSWHPAGTLLSIGSGADGGTGPPARPTTDSVPAR
jgi:hypothetical protein